MLSVPDEVDEQSGHEKEEDEVDEQVIDVPYTGALPECPPTGRGHSVTSLKAKRKAIKDGGINQGQTHGTMQKIQREIMKQKSMDKLNEANVVGAQRNKW